MTVRPFREPTRALVVILIAASLLVIAGCGSSGRAVNSTPVKQNGEESHAFEPEDIERAEEAPESVRRYCEGAVSEAQEVGCLSHVSPDEVP